MTIWTAGLVSAIQQPRHVEAHHSHLTRRIRHWFTRIGMTFRARPLAKLWTCAEGIKEFAIIRRYQAQGKAHLWCSHPLVWCPFLPPCIDDQSCELFMYIVTAFKFYEDKPAGGGGGGCWVLYALCSGHDKLVKRIDYVSFYTAPLLSNICLMKCRGSCSCEEDKIWSAGYACKTSQRVLKYAHVQHHVGYSSCMEKNAYRPFKVSEKLVNIQVNEFHTFPVPSIVR